MTALMAGSGWFHTDAQVMVEQVFFEGLGQMQRHRLTGPACPDSTTDTRGEGGAALFCTAFI